MNFRQGVRICQSVKDFVLFVALTHKSRWAQGLELHLQPGECMKEEIASPGTKSRVGLPGITARLWTSFFFNSKITIRDFVRKVAAHQAAGGEVTQPRICIMYTIPPIADAYITIDQMVCLNSTNLLVRESYNVLNASIVSSVYPKMLIADSAMKILDTNKQAA